MRERERDGRYHTVKLEATDRCVNNGQETSDQRNRHVRLQVTSELTRPTRNVLKDRLHFISGIYTVDMYPHNSHKEIIFFECGKVRTLNEQCQHEAMRLVIQLFQSTRASECDDHGVRWWWWWQHTRSPVLDSYKT